LYLSYRWIV